MSEEEKIQEWLRRLDRTESHVKEHLGDVKFMVSITWPEDEWCHPIGFPEDKECGINEFRKFPHGNPLRCTAKFKTSFVYKLIEVNPLGAWKDPEKPKYPEDFIINNEVERWVYLDFPSFLFRTKLDSFDRKNFPGTCKNFTVKLNNMTPEDPDLENLNSGGGPKGKHDYSLEKESSVLWKTWYYSCPSEGDVDLKQMGYSGDALDVFEKKFPDTHEQVPRGVLDRLGPIHWLDGWVDVFLSLALQKEYTPILVIKNTVYFDDESGCPLCGDAEDPDCPCCRDEKEAKEEDYSFKEDGPNYRDSNDAEIIFSPDSLAEATHHAFEVLRTWAKWGPVSTAGPEVEAKTPDNADSAPADQLTLKSEGNKKPPDGNPGESTNRYDKLDEVNTAAQKAYVSFLYAEAKAKHKLEDRDAYDWIHENGFDKSDGCYDKLENYTLPAFDTWCRYLRIARKATCEQKYTPRHGRATGRSIVSVDEIEHQHEEGN